MNEQEQRSLEILRELGSRPAVPFHEDGPAGYIRAVLAGAGLSSKRDAFGNIIARYRRGTSEPPLALVAHMDHPGFELIEIEGDRAVGRALGGVPVASLIQPTPVLVLASDGRRVPATTSPYGGGTPSDPDDDPSRLVELRLEDGAGIGPLAPVVFDLPDFVLDGETIRMRALDDLAGCAAALAAIERLAGDEAEADVIAVFTRAEEGGLYGARVMAQAGTLPSQTLVVSIEASPVIPGVNQGAGPVIRTGDAATTFSMDAELVLAAARNSLVARRPDFKCQRQLMSGGVCEGTAYAMNGYKVTGLAFPLGNYHNATTRIADPDGGVDAEYIQLPDFLGGVDLLEEAARVAGRFDRESVIRFPATVPDRITKRLKQTAG